MAQTYTEKDPVSPEHTVLHTKRIRIVFKQPASLLFPQQQQILLMTMTMMNRGSLILVVLSKLGLTQTFTILMAINLEQL